MVMLSMTYGVKIVMQYCIVYYCNRLQIHKYGDAYYNPIQVHPISQSRDLHYEYLKHSLGTPP